MPVVVIVSLAILNLEQGATNGRLDKLPSASQVPPRFSRVSPGAVSADADRAAGARTPRAPRRGLSWRSRTALPGCRAACRPIRPSLPVPAAWLGHLDTPDAPQGKGT